MSHQWGDVLLVDVGIADQDEGFIGRRVRDILHMDLQELVVEHPLGLDRVLHLCTTDLAGELPLPDQVLDEFVPEDPLRPVRRVVRLQAPQGRQEQNTGQKVTSKKPPTHRRCSFPRRRGKKKIACSTSNERAAVAVGKRGSLDGMRI